MNRNISVIPCKAHFMSSEMRKKVVPPLVLGHLDYCSVVWSGATRKDWDKLKIFQNRAAKLALGSDFRTSVDFMPLSLSWMKDSLLFFS